MAIDQVYPSPQLQSIDGKVCCRCGIWKPHTYFHNHRWHSDGLQSQCKPCRLIRRRERVAAKSTLPEPDSTLLRVCTECGIEKQLAAFGRFNDGKYGRHAKCKICRYAYTRKWRLEHPEHLSDYEKRKYSRDKRTVVDFYGGCCACCGEDALVFLELHHTQGDGLRHRAEIGTSGAGGRIYKWAISNKFPPIFTVLCANCHAAKTLGVICPHVERREQQS